MKSANRDNTNKRNIADKIFNLVGIPSSLAANLVDDIISITINNLIKENYLKIKNFGSFCLKKKNTRIGRNPRNKIENLESHVELNDFLNESVINLAVPSAVLSATLPVNPSVTITFD